MPNNRDSPHIVWALCEGAVTPCNNTPVWLPLIYNVPMKFSRTLWLFLLLAFLLPSQHALAKKMCKRAAKKFVNQINEQMVLVQGDTFLMGRDGYLDSERPVHKVYVNTFSISKYLITQKQFATFVKAAKYRTDAERTDTGYTCIDKWEPHKGLNWKYDVNGKKRLKEQNNHPAIYITWNDAVSFCKWLSGISGKHFRIPTDAEWEYAARGGKQSHGYLFSGSDSINEVAWNGLNSKHQTHPVGLLKPNELGIYDMSGEVWEWCLDWYL